MPLADSTVPTTFLTIEEASQVARVSGRTLRRWLATGRLPYHQASARSRVLIRPHDLEQFLTRHERNTISLDQSIDEVLISLGGR